MRNLKNLGIALCTLSGVFALIIGVNWLNSPVNGFEPVVTVKVLPYPKLKETLYLKSKTWGLTGDKQFRIITTDIGENIDTSRAAYWLKGLTEVLYQQHHDTLLIYTRSAFHKPQAFASQVKIIQIEVDNPTMMRMAYGPASVHFQRFE